MFVAWIFYGLGAACVFPYRRKYPGLPRPYRVPGYPWTPLLFVSAAPALVLNVIVSTPRNAGIGLGIVAQGFPPTPPGKEETNSHPRKWRPRTENQEAREKISLTLVIPTPSAAEAEGIRFLRRPRIAYQPGLISPPPAANKIERTPPCSNPDTPPHSALPARQSTPLLIHPNPHRLHRTQLRIHHIRNRHRIKQCRRLLPPLVIQKRQRIRDRRPWLNKNARFTSSSFNCVESNGITATGTPAAKSFCADTTSFRMFHSGCGPRAGVYPKSPYRA